MRQLSSTVLLALLLAIAFPLAAQAQPPDFGPGTGRGQGGRGGREGGPRGGGPPSPLMDALDTDKNALSPEEIAKAVEALKTLDKDKDGTLSAEELRPQFGGRGERGRDGAGEADPKEMVTRMLSFDADKDGKLSKEEIPERMAGLLERGDANKDGFLDQDELTKVAEQQAARRQPPRERRSGEGERGERDERRGPPDAV